MARRNRARSRFRALLQEGYLTVLPVTHAPAVTPVRLPYQGEDAGSLCNKDDGIAASLVLLNAREAAGDIWKMRLRSEDRKSDWKPKVELRL